MSGPTGHDGHCAICGAEYTPNDVDRAWSKQAWPDLDIDDPDKSAVVCLNCIRKALKIGLGYRNLRIK